MRLTGTVAFGVPPGVVVEGFDDPTILGLFLPKNSQMTRTGPAAFDVVVIKEAGVLTLRLPGRLTVQPEAGGYLLKATARHMIGGSATLSLGLELVAAGDGCTLSYDGTLESTGLAGRLLQDQADQAQQVMQARFAAMKAELEDRYRARSA